MRTHSPSEVTINVRLEVVLRQFDGQWIACCVPLDVVTQDLTRDGALRGLKEAVELWFESCLERGTLDGAMREAGFNRYKYDEPAPDDPKNQVELTANPTRHLQREFIEVSIPAYIAAQGMLAPHAIRQLGRTR